MKLSLTLGFTTIPLLLALCAFGAAAQDMTARAPTPLTCGNSSAAVPMYYLAYPGAAVNDYFYSPSIGDIDIVSRGDGYNFRGVACYVFTTQALSTIPLFHVFGSTMPDNLYTTSAGERDLALENGYSDAGTVAYIYPSQICGSVPFYRLYNAPGTAHYYTINGTERNSLLATSGWSDEGIAGYVLDWSLCSA
ncbi:hypothetical protein C8F04DRAFT_1260058 [Mycena alexandri]|uniref:DUF5648 domain-containing protein n=1 Tax=Mycena alexandri TaxID=1745969 RepID=A0AAD6SXT7_9AGAR|nr:hypothetical protein C8F04DRAFT_1260058 [Mycena alexandri]